MSQLARDRWHVIVHGRAEQRVREAQWQAGREHTNGRKRIRGPGGRLLPPDMLAGRLRCKSGRHIERRTVSQHRDSPRQVEGRVAQAGDPY
jgi:hypothetical protein